MKYNRPDHLIKVLLKYFKGIAPLAIYDLVETLWPNPHVKEIKDNGDNTITIINNDNSQTTIITGASVVAGDGMDFVTDAPVTLGLPSTIDSTTINEVTEHSHTHELGTISIDDIVSGTPVEYGALYNYFAAIDSRKISSSDDWVIGTYTQHHALQTAIGGQSSGGKLKETGYVHWNSPNTGATNELLFNARGAGIREAGDGSFSQIKEWTTFAQSTEQTSDYHYASDLRDHDGNFVDWRSVLKKNGSSIRLLYVGAGTPAEYIGNNGIHYGVVQIGSQYWINSNLNEHKYRNGDWIHGYDGGIYTPIDNATWAALTTEAMCYYSDIEANGGGQIGLEDIFLKLDQTTPQLTTDTTIADGSKFITNVSNFLKEITWGSIKTLLEVIFLKKEGIIASQGITGFVNPDNITVAYSHANRTMTLTGDLRYVWRGDLKELTSPWVSPPHTATVAKWFLYSTDGTNFTWANSFWSFADCMMAMVNYKATAAATFGIRETHGTMDKDAHEGQHETQGTYLDPVNGGGKATAGTYVLDSAVDADTTPGFDQAIVKDEDLTTTIAAWTQGTYTTMYVGASSIATFNIASSFPFTAAGSYIQINNPLTGAMTNGINLRFYNVYQCLIPVTSDADSQKYRMIFIQPQKEFSSQASAEGEDPDGLLFGDLTNLTAEFKVYARLTYKTLAGDANTGKCRLMSITYVAGTKGSAVNIGGFTPTNHAALSNLNWTASGHIGTASKVAGFGVSGEAVEIDPSSIGATTYLGLSDTDDASYTGKENYIPAVNADEDGLVLTETVAATFLNLDDTPDSYSGQGGKAVAVKSDVTGLEFVSLPAAYTLPTASATVLGGIKIGSGLAIDGAGVVTVSITGSETTSTLGALIGSADDATPNDSDYVATALTAGGVLKKITWTNVKAFFKTYFDSLYAAALGANDNYVTDAEKIVIGNTSGTNSGDNATNTTSNSYADGKVEDSISDGVTTKAPSQNAVFDALAGKQATLSSGTNIKTVNGSTLLGSGDLVTGIMPRGHIWGLTMSNAADTANDITIAAGEACNESSVGDMILPSAITKQIDAAWAVGTNAGGLNTGSVVDNTWYEVRLIKRVDTGVVDVMFTTTANRATLPANYTLARRIGWVRRGSATLLQFTQVDDHFTLTTQINDVAAAKTLTAAAVTLTVPPNSIARFRATADMSTSVNANSAIVFSEVVEGNVTPAISTGIASLGYWDLATGASAGHFELRVNSSSQIEHDADVAVGNFDISTFGWIDHRCRLSNI